jgi:hypothetical protein
MLTLTSSAFNPRGAIPETYTCEGRNSSPPLSWQDVPEETESVLLVCDDPDAPNGTFTHWVLYNIPPLRNELPAHFSPTDELPDGMREGRNSFGNVRYEGPCPPTRDGAHHYHFRLYALDVELDAPPGVNRDQVFDMIHDHVLEETELVGTYDRSVNL